MYPYQTKQVIQVNGENGARAYQMGPNSSDLLLDSTAPLVWLVQTDGAGYKTLTPYKIEPYVPEPPIDVKSLEERIASLEVTLKEELHHEKSNVITAEPDTKSNVWKSESNKTNDVYY